MTPELSEAGRAVVECLIAAPTAWLAPERVARALGLGVEESTDLLCDMDVGGWIDVWVGDDGPRVTLSTLAADRLGLRLVESGVAETPRWARPGDPEPPRPRPRNVCSSPRAAGMEFLPDPLPSPDQVAERGEHAAMVEESLLEAEASATDPPNSATPPRVVYLPPPSLLLGVGLCPWPGPGQLPDENGVCPACGSRTLRPHMYCLCCDRWGLDQLLVPPPEAPDNRPKPAPARESTLSPEAEKLQLEELKARRKAKRLRHAAEQAARDAAKRSPRGPSPRPHPPHRPARPGA